MQEKDIPYGHRLMITLGYISNSVGLIIYPINLILFFNDEITQGLIYKFYALIMSPFLIIFAFQTLNGLRRKIVDSLIDVKKLMVFEICWTLLILIEGIITEELETCLVIYLFDLPLIIFVLIYWGSDSHKNYFESFSKN